MTSPLPRREPNVAEPTLSDVIDLRPWDIPTRQPTAAELDAVLGWLDEPAS